MANLGFDQFCRLSDALADFFEAAQLPYQRTQEAFLHLVNFAPDAINEWESRILSVVPNNLQKNSSQLSRLMPFVRGVIFTNEFRTAHDVARSTVRVADREMQSRDEWTGDAGGQQYVPLCSFAGNEVGFGVVGYESYTNPHEGVLRSWSVERSKALAAALRGELAHLERAAVAPRIQTDDTTIGPFTRSCWAKILQCSERTVQDMQKHPATTRGKIYFCRSDLPPDIDQRIGNRQTTGKNGQQRAK